MFLAGFATNRNPAITFIHISHTDSFFDISKTGKVCLCLHKYLACIRWHNTIVFVSSVNQIFDCSFLESVKEFQMKMSKLDEVVNKIKVKMSEKNDRQSSIKFLPYCPAEAKAKKRVGQQSAVESKSAVPKFVNDDDLWKLTWMTEYNSSRQLLDEQSKSIIEKSKEIEQLKESNRNQAKLVCEFSKRLMNKNIIIQQLAHCLANGLQKNDAPEEAEIASPQFEPNESQPIQSCTDSDDYNTNTEIENEKSIKQAEESEIATNPEKTVSTKRELIQYLCPHCSYYTNKKSSMDDHVAEFCENSPVKNMQCKICFKMFTRRGLRIHFNNFTTGKHAPRGEHADFTPEIHEFFKVAAMNGFEYP